MRNVNFSVIITTFNRSKKLLLALNSVLNQKHRPKEIIIINNYQKKIQKKNLKCKNKNVIKIYNLKKNLHSADGRNYGAQLSKNNFIAFLDDDDEWDSMYLYKANKIIQKKNTDVILTNLYYKNNKLKILKKVKDLNLQDCFVMNPGCMGSNLIINRGKFFKLGGFNKKFIPAEDRELLIRIIMNKLIINISNSKVYYDVDSNDSISKKLNLILIGHTNLKNKYQNIIKTKNKFFINMKLNKILYKLSSGVIIKLIYLFLTFFYYIGFILLR
ncbi:glycosyltransferase [Candidatus Pelagibacter ubique]|nr:glycosyltransferase [Candidatus Pelagibacter ubique]